MSHSKASTQVTVWAKTWEEYLRLRLWARSAGILGAWRWRFTILDFSIGQIHAPDVIILGKEAFGTHCLDVVVKFKGKKRKPVTVLFWNWAPSMEVEWRKSSTYFLTSAVDGGEWSASCPGRFTLRERAPATHWIGWWVATSAVLDAVVKRKIPNPRRVSNHITPIVRPLAQRYTDWAITENLELKRRW
jgi:hypothetical protein